MYPERPVDRLRVARWRTGSLLFLCACVSAGCSFFHPQVDPLHEPSGENRRTRLWEIEDPRGTGVPATQPVATRPAEPPDLTDEELLSEPYQLNTNAIIRLVHHKSPLVAASRQNMIAAQYGLEEFKANLSRFEPFARAEGEANAFPERRDSRGIRGEATFGLEKETFDGAVFRVEGGASGERVEFGDLNEDLPDAESGNGGLLRARVEVPFIGSRKRQNRVISAAFQESSARAAVLQYLTNYRTYVLNALDYYSAALVYLRYTRAYEEQLVLLEALLEDSRIKPEDRLRIQTSAGDTRVVRDQYASSYKSYLMLTLQYVGITPDEAYVLDEPPLTMQSRYSESTSTSELRELLLSEAYDNNPKFRVLTDAIKDSELKRKQAIIGTNDITAFAEGTQFAFGSETFDDRVRGWQLRGGVSFRLNDQRVLTASRKKAEAEVRGFQAQIEAEQLSVQRQIAVQSAVIRSYEETRPQILENIQQAAKEFEERRAAYFEGKSPILTIDDVLTPLSSLTVAKVRLASNLYSGDLAENDLLAATGEVYRIVGLKMSDNGNGVDLPDLE